METLSTAAVLLAATRLAMDLKAHIEYAMSLSGVPAAARSFQRPRSSSSCRPVDWGTPRPYNSVVFLSLYIFSLTAGDVGGSGSDSGGGSGSGSRSNRGNKGRREHGEGEEEEEEEEEQEEEEEEEDYGSDMDLADSDEELVTIPRGER